MMLTKVTCLPFGVAHFPGEPEEGIHRIRTSREDEYERCGGAHICIQDVQVYGWAFNECLAKVLTHEIYCSKNNLWSN